MCLLDSNGIKLTNIKEGLEMRKPLDRRTMLKGAGVAIAMPMLEAMLPMGQAAFAKAKAAKPVKRFVSLSNNYGVYHKAFFPNLKQSGAKYDMPETLKSLEKHRKDITVFQNLDHGNTGGHAGVPVLLSGVRPFLAQNYAEGNISLDQKLAEHHGSATRFPSMTVKCGDSNLVSFTRTGVQVPSIDMRQMYRQMFFEDSPQRKASAAERFKRHNSILDVVNDQAKSVNKTLGRQDQKKFAEYLDAVRTMEKKIVQQEPWVKRPKPKTKVKEPQPTRGNEGNLKLTIEMMALAIQTDSTRAITLTSGFASGDFGLRGGYHGFSHHGEQEEKTSALKKIEGYQIQMMSHLVDLLKAQPDTINGGTLLDHTHVFFGCGMAKGTHSNRNMPLVLAGGGFQHGNHYVGFEDKGQRIPAANLLLSILQNCGLGIDRFGTSTGTLTGFERKRA
jgi:hypothetical protein